MFSVASKYIVGFLAMITVVQAIAIYNYRNEIESISKDILIKSVNEQTCRDAIEMQNNAITDIGLIYEERIESYNKKMSSAGMTRYVNRYVEVKDENKSECNTIKSILGNISRIGL